MENRLHECKRRSREVRLEATALVQARDDGDVVQGRRYAGDEKLLVTGYTLEIKPVGLDMGCERSRAVKDNTDGSLENTRSRMGLPSAETEETDEKRMERSKVQFGPYQSEMTACLCAQSLSRVWLFETSQIVTRQASLSVEFSRQAYRSRLPFPPPEDLTHAGIQPESLASLALAGGRFATAPPGMPALCCAESCPALKTVARRLLCP